MEGKEGGRDVSIRRPRRILGPIDNQGKSKRGRRGAEAKKKRGKPLPLSGTPHCQERGDPTRDTQGGNVRAGKKEESSKGGISSCKKDD